MTREIVTSENRDEYIKKKLINKEPKKIIHPMSKKDFDKYYIAQHKDMKSTNDEEKQKTQESIISSGFKKGFNVNALPVYRGGKPQDITASRYGNKKGDKVYLLPKSGVNIGRNGYLTKEGHIPSNDDIIDIENDYESSYEAYLRKHKKQD